jgi:hypothetical protein
MYMYHNDSLQPKYKEMATPIYMYIWLSGVGDDRRLDIGWPATGGANLNLGKGYLSYDMSQSSDPYTKPNGD